MSDLTKFEFCDKQTGKITQSKDAEAITWIAKNYHDTQMMLESMRAHPGQWYNGMFSDCRFVG